MLPMDGFVVRCIFGRAGCELAPLLTSPAGGGGTAPSPRAGRAGADKGTSLEFTVCEARTLFRPHPQPLSHCVGEGCRGARRCALQRVPPLPPAGEGDKGGEGTSLGFAVRRERTLFCPHPQPLSQSVREECRGARRRALPRVGEGRRGARQCALPRVEEECRGARQRALQFPLARPAGEGDTGGEGKQTVHAASASSSAGSSLGVLAGGALDWTVVARLGGVSAGIN